MIYWHYIFTSLKSGYRIVLLRLILNVNFALTVELLKTL